jgi:hypothetical protein
MSRKQLQLTEREQYRYLEQIEALIEKVEKGNPLSIAERRLVADVLRQHWLPKRELHAYRQQLRLGSVEVMKAGAKRARAQSGMSAADWADRVATGLGFPSAGAMEKFVTRARKEKPDN